GPAPPGTTSGSGGTRRRHSPNLPAGGWEVRTRDRVRALLRSRLQSRLKFRRRSRTSCRDPRRSIFEDPERNRRDPAQSGPACSGGGGPASPDVVALLADVLGDDTGAHEDGEDLAAHAVGEDRLEGGGDEHHRNEHVS